MNRDLWAWPSWYLVPEGRDVYKRDDERLLSDGKSEIVIPPSHFCDWVMYKCGGGDRICEKWRGEWRTDGSENEARIICRPWLKCEITAGAQRRPCRVKKKKAL